MATLFKQADSRWAKKAYPKKCTVGGSGCGLCSMVNLLNEYEKYKSATPLTFYSYMVKGAVEGDGTKRAHMVDAMKHYGFKDVVRFGNRPISEAWPLFKKGYRGVFVMSSAGGGSKKTKWTTSGHYIAITDYKEANGKHYLYVKDSSWRNNDGWKTYEENMRGAVSEVIVGDPVELKKSTKPSTESIKKAAASVNTLFDKVAVKNLQKVLGTTQDGVISGQNTSAKKYLSGFESSCIKYGKGGSRVVKALQKKVGATVDGYLGPNTIKKVQKMVGAEQDGSWGKNTSKLVIAWVNKQLGSKTTTSNKTSTTNKTATSTKVNETVIDVSYVQKNIDWAKVKAAGVKGVIVRCGYRGYGSGKLMNDDYFLSHIKGASKAGLKVGTYFFTEAVNAAEGKAEAQFTINRLKEAGVTFHYPIAIDTEAINASNPTPRANNLSVAKRTEAVKAFCEEVKRQGYEPMIYASTSWFNNKLDMKQLPYKIWCAQYASKCEYKGSYIMWQYSSKGKVNGISGVVDMNHCYISGASVTPKVESKSVLKDVAVVAQEVLDGKWGAGTTRKNKLTEAGYNYDSVQNKVNELLKAKADAEAAKKKAEEEAAAIAKAQEEARAKAEAEARKKAEEEAARNSDENIAKIAQEVLDGKWGSGATRKEKLTAAGYNYDKVQSKVNELLKSSTITSSKVSKAVEWAIAMTKNDAYGYKRWTSDVNTHKCPICYPDSGKGFNCIGFVGAALKHGGGIPVKCSMSGIATNSFGTNVTEESWRARNGKDWKMITNGGAKNGSAIPASKLQPGDVLLMYKSNGEYQHTAMYIGNNQIAESATDSLPKAQQIRISTYSGKRFTRAFRYTGDAQIKVLKSVEEIANEVLDGKWGSGAIRKSKLVEAGYNYDAIQNKVNEILKQKTEEAEILAKAAEEARLKAKAEEAARKKAEEEEKARIAAEEEAKRKAEEERVNKINALAQLLYEQLSQNDISLDEVLKQLETLSLPKEEEELPVEDPQKEIVEPIEEEKEEVVEPVEEPKKVSVEQLAQEVLDGKWGSGAKRKDALTAAGHDYEAVQNKVNELLKTNSSAEPQKGSYTGKLPTMALTKSNAQVIADTIRWLKWHATDNSFHYGYTSKDRKIDAHHNGCYYCGTQAKYKNTKMVGYEKSYCCNPFIGAGFAHGGCVPEALKLCKKGDSWDFHKNTGYDKSKLFTNLGHPAKSTLKPGDVLCKDGHVAVYVGDGKIVEAATSDDNVRNSKKWNNSIHITNLSDGTYAKFPRVHRYNSSVKTTCAIAPGELSNRVKLWQEYLNWYFGKKVVSVDGEYGDDTWKYTKEFQEKEIGKGQGDGYIGQKTLDAAAKVEK